MGQPAGKVGDSGQGFCPCHEGGQSYMTTIISGASNVMINGAPAANMTSTGVATCGHTTSVLSVSGQVFVGGSGSHRMGDSGMNCGPYTLLGGSGNVLVG